MKSFFNYYGAKTRSAGAYPFPYYSTIIEPFAGSAGYSTYYADHQIWLWDIDPTVAGLWKWLIEVDPQDILDLPETVLHLDDWPDLVPQAAKDLIGFWLNPGSAQPKKTLSSWGLSGKASGFWGEVVRARIAKQVSGIRHWRARWGSYLDIPNQTATWYIDPPYQKAGTFYKYSAIDYRILAEWCQSRKGQVIVCENAGADWLPFRPFSSEKAASGKQKKNNRSEEVIWTKGVT